MAQKCINFCISDMLLGDGPFSYDEARDFCLYLGRDLLSVHSEEDRDAARALCQSIPHDGEEDWGCWLGLSKLDGMDAWSWSDGAQTDYGFAEYVEGVWAPSLASDSPWSTGQPDNYDEAGDECTNLAKHLSFDWNNCRCDEHENYALCGPIKISPYTNYVLYLGAADIERLSMLDLALLGAMMVTVAFVVHEVYGCWTKRGYTKISANRAHGRSRTVQ